MSSIRNKVLVSAGLMLAIASGGFWYTINHNPANIYAPQTSVAAKQVELKQFKGSGFHTSIPTDLRLKTGNDAVGQTLAQYMFADTQAQNSNQLAISVGPHDDELPLSEAPLAKVRAINPGRYQPANWSWLPPNALAYQRTDEAFEIGVFFTGSNSRYVSIIASGTADQRSNLEDALRSAVTNWQWE